MKHLKIFENFEDDERFKVGDYVIIIEPYSESLSKFKHGEKCKIIDIKRYLNMQNRNFLMIENEDGVEEGYFTDRVIPEVEYNANKYNL